MELLVRLFKIYTRIKHLLGAPIRSVEIEDEMMEEKEALFEKIKRELMKYNNNPTKYFEKTITDNSREAQRMIKKLSKLYSLVKSSKEPKESINPDIALKEFDFLPEKRTKITNKRSF